MRSLERIVAVLHQIGSVEFAVCHAACLPNGLDLKPPGVCMGPLSSFALRTPVEKRRPGVVVATSRLFEHLRDPIPHHVQYVIGQ